MDIYIDIIFLVEFVMIFFLLWSSGILSGFRVKKKKVFISSIITSIIYCLILVINFNLSKNLILGLALMALSVFLSFGMKNIKNFLRILLTLVFSSFLLNGGLNLLFIHTKIQNLFGEVTIIRPVKFPFIYLIWAVCLFYVLIKLSARWIEVNITNKRQYCTIYILKNDKWVEGKVLIDTGNGLKYREKGVAVMEILTILPLFSKEEGLDILNGNKDLLIPLNFTSLGNSGKAMWGFIASEVKLCFGEKVISLKEIYIGISFDFFNGAYEGLIPSGFLEED